MNSGQYTATFGIVVLVLIIAATVVTFFLRSLQKTMRCVPQEKRLFPDWYIWMMLFSVCGLVLLAYHPTYLFGILCSLVGFIFYWLILPFGIPNSLSNTVIGNNAALRALTTLKIVALIMLVIVTINLPISIYLQNDTVNQFIHSASPNTMSNHPFLILMGLLNFPLNIVHCLLWIIYWVKVVSFRKTYLDHQSLK